MQIKTRLHRSYSAISVIVLLVTGIIILLTTQGRISRRLDKELTQTNLLLYKMVENVFDINQNLLLNNLNIFEKQVLSSGLNPDDLIESDAEHYITQLTDYIQIQTLNINGKAVFEDTELVDHVADITGGNVSVLQMFPEGLLRISTNILRTDGTRATQVYYPNETEITSTLRAGDVYIDKTFEMGEWYIVAYKPVSEQGRVIGALQVGIKPDINSLRRHILDIRIGQTGIPFIVDTEGILVLSAENENENVYHLPHIKTMINARSNGTLVYKDRDGKGPGSRKIIIAYQYLPDMEWIVASGSYLQEFYGDLWVISWIIALSIIMALLISVFVSLKLAEILSRPINLLTDCMAGLRDISYDFSNFNRINQIRDRIDHIDIRAEEIDLMAATFKKMLEELEDAQRQMISRHRRYRETELIRKVDESLLPDYEKLQDRDPSPVESVNIDAAGEYFDMSTGPDGQIWYLVGTSGEQSDRAAIFMMMAQASLNSILKEIPDASPVEVIRMLNGYLAGEINRRMGRDDMYRVSIIVCSSSGWIQYAGPRPVLRVYHHEAAAFERIKTHCRVVKDSDLCRIFSATFRLKQGNLLLLGKERDSQDSLRIIEEHWQSSADELNRQFRVAGSQNLSEESPGLFFLKLSS